MERLPENSLYADARMLKRADPGGVGRTVLEYSFKGYSPGNEK